MPGGDFSNALGPLFSPEVIRTQFLPGIKQLVQRVHQAGLPILTHNCGNNWKLLDLFIEAGFDCWQSIQVKTADMDLARLKERYGDKLSFWGGINLEVLIDGSPEEARQDVIDALKNAAPGGGLILGTSNSVAYGSSYDVYMTALDTLRQYGGYPIEI
jgi:uroporphyrinogen-III decarboxylase